MDTPPPKKDVLLALLTESWVHIQLDGRAAGVDLPEWLASDPAVVLQIGYDMPVPIPDLTIDDDGVRCTLSFRRTPHACKIPFSAIYRIVDVDGRGAVYIDDVPPELLRPATAAPQGQAQAAKGPDIAPRPAAAPAPAPELAQEAPVSTPRPGKKPRPSHLKLVK